MAKDSDAKSGHVSCIVLTYPREKLSVEMGRANVSCFNLSLTMEHQKLLFCVLPTQCSDSVLVLHNRS